MTRRFVDLARYARRTGCQGIPVHLFSLPARHRSLRARHRGGRGRGGRCLRREQGHRDVLGAVVAARAAIDLAGFLAGACDQVRRAALGRVGRLAVMVPASTPRAIVELLHAEIGKALAGKDVRDKLTAQGLTPRGTAPDELARDMRAQYARYGQLIRQAGITAD